MERRKKRAVLLVVIAVLCLGRIATYSRFTTGSYLVDSDLSPDYVSAAAWRTGGQPYDRTLALYDRHLGADAARDLSMAVDQRNAHPPAYVALYGPLSSLTLRQARILFLILTVLAVVFGAFLLCRELGISREGAALAGLAAAATPLVEFDARWGQSNGLLMLLLVLAWLNLRRDRPRTAGVMLGAAAALRLFPWMLVIPLIRMRRWNTAGWMVATTAVVSVGGMFALGANATKEFISVASPGNFRIWEAAPYSMSVVALPFRLLASNTWLNPNGRTPALLMMVALAYVAMCGVGAASSRMALTGDPFWSATPWMILGSPLAWIHYLVVLIPFGILVLVRGLPRAAADRAAIIACLVVVALGDSFIQGVAAISGVSLMRFGTVVALSSIVIGGILLPTWRDATAIPSSPPPGSDYLSPSPVSFKPALVSANRRPQEGQRSF